MGNLVIGHRERTAGTGIEELPVARLLHREEAGVMEHAERVKFGGDRPDADEAEREVSAARSWVEGTQT